MRGFGLAALRPATPTLCFNSSVETDRVSAGDHALTSRSMARAAVISSGKHSIRPNLGGKLVMPRRNYSQKFRVLLLPFLTFIALLVPQALAQTVSLSFDLRQQDPDRMEPHENKSPVT